MEKSKDIQCIIFDCDGTLVDSEKLSQQALTETFAQFGVTLDATSYWQHFKGGKMSDILAETCSRVGLQARVDDLEPVYRKACERVFLQGIEPIAGVPELLDTLEAQGYEMCIASNAPIEKVKHTLKLTGLDHYFTGKIFSGFDANSWKPEPDVIHYAAMLMGIPLDKCIFIDDTVRGVEAGINAHVQTFHLLSTPDGQRIDHPNVIPLANMTELLNYISQSKQEKKQETCPV
ncbi:HAD-IA family hydrolase [Photobacterium sanguinicancri]|uniref:Phosphatase n=1 Tax=Photobacterium sanguinicancri TaxID=875932 RepID=A0ABX4FTR6_9GAMM|nr:HAD-IA family hydrolase [Photobacterium sanguinicancri]MDO6498370.1 HAD-IA family hydrolase [Photobacterium sanguinicancri]OZS42262.1 phosphatase [Photobacterium sanguinicancri]